jgi:hypothetical protein
MKIQKRSPKRRYKLLKYCIIAGIALAVISPILVRHTITECDDLLQTPNIAIPSNAVEIASDTATNRNNEYILWLSMLGNRSELQREVLNYQIETNYEDIQHFMSSSAHAKVLKAKVVVYAAHQLKWVSISSILIIQIQCHRKLNLRYGGIRVLPQCLTDCLSPSKHIVDRQFKFRQDITTI